MEAIIKETIRIGNSSGVLLPKKWENKKVRVELIEDSIIKNVFDIINKEGLLKKVIGIYLTGSYARNEERIDSDIDILIVTSDFNKFLKEKNYEILFISKEKLDKTLENSLYLYSLIKEAKPILNVKLLDEYKSLKLKLSLKKLLSEIKSIIKINEGILDLNDEKDKKIIDGTAYSLVLRSRELFLIECLLNNKMYKSNDFLEIIKKNASIDIYDAYLRIKNNKKEKNNCNIIEAKKLLSYIKETIKKFEEK